MNKEINTIIANLEGCIGMFDYLLTPTESNLLVLYIEELQQENQQLNEDIKVLFKENCNKEEVIKRHEDNWNKLKEHIKSEWTCFDNESVEFEVSTDILDKMQEIEGNDSDE